MNIVEPAAPMASPNDQSTGALFGRVAACITQHGVTAGQAEALRKITRFVIDAGDPSGAARKVLDLINAEQVTV
jgi:hypothetical protein